VRTLLDEGNDAFEAGNYSGALRSYEAAVEADSTAAPAWFGLYMTYDALGETEKARELRARLTEMSPPGPGDPHAVPAEDGPPSLEGSAAREEGA
jgi:Flp pilus assembly protein TadD